LPPHGGIRKLDLRARNRLGKFLLRHGRRPAQGWRICPTPLPLLQKKQARHVAGSDGVGDRGIASALAARRCPIQYCCRSLQSSSENFHSVAHSRSRVRHCTRKSLPPSSHGLPDAVRGCAPTHMRSTSRDQRYSSAPLGGAGSIVNRASIQITLW
jgi:hypothetical protein